MSKRLSTLRKEHAIKQGLARQFLQQKSAMIRMGLTPVEYLCVQMGCSIATAERLIHEIKEDDEEEDPNVLL